MESDSAQIFRALGLDTRLKIVQLLKSNGPMCVSNIADELQITSSAVSQHLRMLRQAGLVDSSRQGFWIPYTLNEEAMENCRRMVNDICTCSCKHPSNVLAQKPESDDLHDLQHYRDKLKKALEVTERKIERMNKGKD